MTAERIYLGLGANLGDRLANLSQALHQLACLPETVLLNYSSIYESHPLGQLKQNDYLNMVVLVGSTLAPEALLAACQRIERELGRVRTGKWDARTIDIDILYWGDRVLNAPALQIPHPEAARRDFVLVPIREITPDFCAPPGGTPVDELLSAIPEPTGLRLFLPKERYVAC